MLRGEPAWAITDHLLAKVADINASGNWQRGGGKGRKPRPIQRPGQGSDTRTTFGGSGEGVTPEELEARLAEPRQEIVDVKEVI